MRTECRRDASRVSIAQRRGGGAGLRSAAAQRRHSTLSGRASRRARSIGAPQASQVPYVPSSSLASARSVRASVLSSERPTPISVSRPTASVVPSPIRLPKPCAVSALGPLGEAGDAVAGEPAVIFERRADHGEVERVVWCGHRDACPTQPP